MTFLLNFPALKSGNIWSSSFASSIESLPKGDLLPAYMTCYSELPLEGEDNVVERHFAGDARILGPSWTRMPALTVRHLGVSVLWSLKMSSGTYGSLVKFPAHMH